MPEFDDIADRIEQAHARDNVVPMRPTPPADGTDDPQGSQCVHCGCVATAHPVTNRPDPSRPGFFLTDGTCSCGKCPGYQSVSDAEAQADDTAADAALNDEQQNLPPDTSAAETPAPATNAAAAPADASVTVSMWICNNCGTTNTRNEKKPFQKCKKCDELAPGEKERLEAGLSQMRGGVATPDEVESVERGAAGLPARDRSLPFSSKGGRFDVDSAFDELHNLSELASACEAEYEELKEKTSLAKKRWEAAQETFQTRFEDLYELKEKSAAQPDLFAEAERREALGKSECPVERSTGAPCPACQSQRAKGKPADPSEPLHPAHPQHEDVAKALLIKDLNELRAQLEKKNFFVDVAELTTLSVNDLQALQRFGAQRGPIPSEAAAAVLKGAHLAAEPGTDRQECKRCGIDLVDRKDIDNGVTFFPALVMVGLGCEGLEEVAQPADTPALASPVDDASARPPQSHAQRDRRQPKNPEAERKTQTAEGKKKAAKKAKKR